jgi:hypothetical protein
MRLPYPNRPSGPQPPYPLSSRPQRTRISYFALLATSTCAALRRESRMQIIKATGLDRKSGEAQWRDLRFPHPQTARPVNHRPTLCHLDRSEA